LIYHATADTQLGVTRRHVQTYIRSFLILGALDTPVEPNSDYVLVIGMGRVLMLSEQLDLKIKKAQL